MPLLVRVSIFSRCMTALFGCYVDGSLSHGRCVVHKQNKISVYCESCKKCICHECALWGREVGAGPGGWGHAGWVGLASQAPVTIVCAETAAESI